MRTGRGGFALAAALLLLMVVSGLLLEGALRARAERRLAWNAAVEVRARAAARGGTAHVLLRLRGLQARTVAAEGADPALTDAWNLLDTVGARLGEVSLPGGGRYRVTVRDAASLLPLNQATGDELYRLFRALGAAEDAARAAALAAVDRRERAGPFGAPGELLRDGVAPDLPRTVPEHLTVLGDGRVNLNTAPGVVLGVLPGMTSEAVSRVLARRAGGRAYRTLFELEAELSPPAREELQRSFAALVRRAAFEPALLEVTSEGRVEGSGLRATEYTVGVRAGSGVQILSSVER